VSRVLRLPAQGRLLVCTDLQGNLGDFVAVADRFAAAGPGAHLVITGDLVHGPDDETADDWPAMLGTRYRDESVRLLQAFEQLARACPGRVHALLGNHDHAHVGGPVTSKFHPDEARALEQRLDPAGVAWLRTLISSFALVATAPCGVVLLHAAPSAPIDGPADLEALTLDGYEGRPFTDLLATPVLGPLLWSRMARDHEAERFVRALGAEVAIYGHDIVREGWAKDGPRQLCVSTSFGLVDAAKTYVELDLGAHYHSVDDFHEGVELRRLHH
jgi:hypothetical protein